MNSSRPPAALGETRGDDPGYGTRDAGPGMRDPGCGNPAIRGFEDSRITDSRSVIKVVSKPGLTVANERASEPTRAEWGLRGPASEREGVRGPKPLGVISDEGFNCLTSRAALLNTTSCSDDLHRAFALRSSMPPIIR